MKLNQQLIYATALFALFASIRVNAKLFEVTENNWERLLSKNEWMVEFYAPWCPACNRFESTWKEFSKKSDELGVKVGAADVNSNPVLSGLFSVTSLPTVYHIKDGQYRVYNGTRDLETLVNFILNKEWQNIEPSSSWLTPNSFIIKMLSTVFRLTLKFKDLYTHLNESYGLPTWAVLTIFVVITIMIGLALGIALIVCIDCIFPPKRDPAGEALANQDVIADDDETEATEKTEKNTSKSNDKESSSNMKRRSRVKKDN